MGLKIFYALRAPADRLNDVIDFLHDHMMRHLIGDYEALLQSVNIEALDKKYNCRTDAERKFYRHYMVSDYIDRLKAALKQRDRVLPVLECGFSLWIQPPYVYVVLDGPENYYADLFARRDKLSDKCPGWMENYQFQGQIRTGGEFAYELTQEYEARGEVWINLTQGGLGTKQAHNARRLYHPVFQPDLQYWAELQTLYEMEEKEGGKDVQSCL